MYSNNFELDLKNEVVGDERQSKARVSGHGSRVSSNNAHHSSYKAINDVTDGDKFANLVNSEAEVRTRALENDIDGRGDVNSLMYTVSESRVSKADWEGDSGKRKHGASDMQMVNDHDHNSGSEQWGSAVKDDGINSEEKGLLELTTRSSDHKFGAWGHSSSGMVKGHEEVGKCSVSQYDSMITMSDEFAGNGKGKSTGAELSTFVGYGYEAGDMVWGKVKSHPWWPGHIFNEAFASPSVRRSKRAGHVLVAFFSDSSYGWFDPAELIPFDATFHEKSRQTNVRNFVKAVEEAVDEVSRRCGLGLACRCRNPYNFRPTNVQGHFAVDVGDYEPGAVYSTSQITKARDSFRPGDTLAFLKQLSLMRRSDVFTSIEFIKNKATILAYRKAAFEEFDETYAQAFGQQPVRPTLQPMEAWTQPVRAPLSGPLVIAEALGKKKSSTKPNKTKDQAKKDKFLFKRRDEPSELKVPEIRQAASSLQPASAEGSVKFTAGDYVLQKRDPEVSKKQQIPTKLEGLVAFRMDGGSVSSRDGPDEDEKLAMLNMAGSPAPANFPDSFPLRQAPSNPNNLLEPKSSFDEGKDAQPEMKENTGYHNAPDPKVVIGPGFAGRGTFHGGIGDVLQTLAQEGEAIVDSEHVQQSATTSKLDEVSLQPQSIQAMVNVHGLEKNQSGGIGGHFLSTNDATFLGEDSRMTIGPGTKKAKLLKRAAGDLGVEKSAAGKKKMKKKRKKELGEDIFSDSMQKQSANGKGSASAGRGTGNALQVGLPSRGEFQVEHRKDGGPGSSLLPDSLRMQPIVGTGNVEFKLPQVLGDLKALALNPFHGLETYTPVIIRETFLKFRSVVYQKSLALSVPAEEMEPNEVLVPKFSSGSLAGSDNPPSENFKDLPSLKPPKARVRPEDPTKGGRKRSPSDRQEELAAKRSKKINDMKSLASEKKAAKKHPEAEREGKETGILRPPKPLKQDFVKKKEPPSKARQPTFLVMKFPKDTALPSAAELRARLARFGPLDHSATRVFWESSTCRIVFLHRADAEAAHRHISGNNTLFGKANVRCHTRPVEETATEDVPVEPMQQKDSAVKQRPPAATPTQHRAVQLKSCLKKPVGDEAGTPSASGGNGNGRVTPRVKFVLGGGESSGGEQTMVGNKNSNNASFADDGASSSSHGMDFNSKNFQKFIVPPHPLPLLPLPIPRTAQFQNAPNNVRYSELAPRNAHYYNTNTAPAVPTATSIDIAQPMLSLLTRCNDVVTHMRSFLGYVPYHPL